MIQAFSFKKKKDNTAIFQAPELQGLGLSEFLLSLWRIHLAQLVSILINDLGLLWICQATKNNRIIDHFDEKL